MGGGKGRGMIAFHIVMRVKGLKLPKKECICIMHNFEADEKARVHWGTLANPEESWGSAPFGPLESDSVTSIQPRVPTNSY